MRVVIQRVTKASVEINQQARATISSGLLVLVGIAVTDTPADVAWMVKKIMGLRIFNDDDGVMNLSISDINGELLLVSQFTLQALTKKGNRPSYIMAARPEQAIPLYELMIQQLEEGLGKPIATGVFGADMQVQLINDGPVTILIDSQE